MNSARLPDLAQLIVDRLRPIVEKYGGNGPVLDTGRRERLRMELRRAMRILGGPRTPADAWALHQYLTAQSYRFAGVEWSTLFAARHALDRIILGEPAQCPADMLARLDWLAARMNEEEVADERTQFAAMLQGDIRRLCRAGEPGGIVPGCAGSI
jgi:hypothetical protein